MRKKMRRRRGRPKQKLRGRKHPILRQVPPKENWRRPTKFRAFANLFFGDEIRRFIEATKVQRQSQYIVERLGACAIFPPAQKAKCGSGSSRRPRRWPETAICIRRAASHPTELSARPESPSCLS